MNNFLKATLYTLDAIIETAIAFFFIAFALWVLSQIPIIGWISLLLMSFLLLSKFKKS